MVERTASAPRRRAASASGPGASRPVTRQPLVARRAEELLGTSVVATAPVAGGDIATATRLRLSDGTTALMKTLPHAPDGLLHRRGRRAALARRGRPGRRRARARGARRRPRVPDHPLGRAGQELGRRRRRARPRAGRHPRGRAPTLRPATATATSAGCRCPTGRPTPGRSSTPSAGCCPTSSWPATAAPSTDDRGRDRSRPSSPGSPDLVPEEPPARLHGDLWNGNVLWGLDGHAWLIDPAAYGGHREVDLAMLALFGLPHLPRVLDAYARGRAARRRLGGPRARCTRSSRCWCTPATSAVGTPPARPQTSPPTVRLTTVPVLSTDSGCGWQSGAVTTAPGPKPRVLVVDDDKAVRESLRRSLEFNGYDVSLAGDGAEALAGDRRHRARRRRDGRDDAAARRPRGDPRAAQRRQRPADPGAHRPRRRRRPGRGPRRRRRRLPHQAVRPPGAAGPAARAAAPGRPARGRRSTRRSPSPTSRWTSPPARCGAATG